MRIRKFRASDSAAVARLHRDTIRNINSKDYPPEQVAVWAKRSTARRMKKSLKDRQRYVAIEKNRIVGFGDYKKDGEMSGLYIHKDYIGKGAGSKLLNKMETEAAKRGIREFHTISTITARNFYEKHGYHVVEKSKHRIKNQELTVYKMRKTLKT